MLALNEASPVKVFVGALWGDGEAWTRALEAMVAQWGVVDARAAPVPFTFTDYYLAEMGGGLMRELVSFAALVCPGSLPELKLAANRIEAELCRDGRRTVNLDVGYLDYHKVVLASTKAGSHRVYLRDGIWAEMTLMYSKGDFHALPWTFIDFKSGVYNVFLREVRQRYKAEVRTAEDAS